MAKFKKWKVRTARLFGGRKISVQTYRQKTAFVLGDQRRRVLDGKSEKL